MLKSKYHNTRCDPFGFAVCEVLESNWVEELRAASVPEWRDYWVMRHFILYLDSVGCFEVIAESAALEDEGVKNSGDTSSVSQTPFSA